MANKHGPLMHLQLGEVSTIVVSSPEFAKEVMKTHDVTFASRPSILASKILSYDSTNIGFAPYGNYWRQLRKICTLELLSQKRVESYQPIREEELSTLISWIGSKAGSTINLTEKMFTTTCSITSRAAFGKKCKDQEKFISNVKQSVELSAGFNIADLFPSVKLLHLVSRTRTNLERLHQEADRIMGNIINEHKEQKATKKTDENVRAEDLIDVLLKFHQEHSSDSEFSLTISNIKAVILAAWACQISNSTWVCRYGLGFEMGLMGFEAAWACRIAHLGLDMATGHVLFLWVAGQPLFCIVDIFSAGSETSTTTVDWAMSEMIKKSQIVKETLRLHAPVPLLLPRECGERCKLKGYEIPIKTKVIVNAWAIGRDPKYWNEAEKFYPERFLDSSIDYKGTNFEYIPFGAGRRICPGITFGLANVELPLALYLYHFDWKLPNGMKNEDLDMTEAFGITVRRKDDLQLIPIAYHPLPVV
uniref:Cytochrome P450 n=1 Tax=Fagus sylvatica TaxID=28930 RepID=A0A2N9EGE0_FAGSY